MIEAASMMMAIKPIMTLDEACNYAGLSKSAMYKLTHERKVPFSKPNGKCIYFSRTDLDAWMMGNRVATVQEIADEAAKRTASTARRRKKGGTK